MWFRTTFPANLLIYHVYRNQGNLKGYDQTINIILEECYERVYSTVSGVEQVVLGLYIIRGDNMYVTTF